jgi:putative flippase GtrA
MSPIGTLLVRMSRCMAVSVFTTLLSLAVFLSLLNVMDVTAWKANVVATAVGTVPSYLLNRRWVWGRTGSGDLRREIVPFWALSFTGLVVSTVVVDRAEGWVRAAHIVGAQRSLALAGANIAAFGSLWVMQFLLLDKVLFVRRDLRPGEQCDPHGSGHLVGT